MLERLGLLGVLLLALLVAPARAAYVTGAWRATISTTDGTITGKASLKQAGETVTAGWGLTKTTQFRSPEFLKETSSPLRRLLNLDGLRPSINAT